MAMQLETISYDVHANMAKVILNRPQAKNAVNLQMAKDLLTAATACSTDPAIRVLVITGSGGAFSVGGDIKEFSSYKDQLPGYLKEITTYLHAAISTFARLEVPVITGVNGVAAGAGIGLSCLGDVIIAAESARFTMAYSGIGLTPDAGATYFLPRLIGLRHTLDMLMTNRLLSSAEALEWGLVTQVVPDSDLAANLNTLSTAISGRATKALAGSKYLIYRGLDGALETQMDDERKFISEMGQTSDAIEGITAFNEKRKANFIGH